MADLFIVGKCEGVASTTAVSIGSQVMHMIVGFAMGATVMIGQAVSVIVSLIVILKNGIPVALQDGFIHIAFIVITIITVCFGIMAAVIMQTFLHNILVILFVRILGVYLTSILFPITLLPMRLAAAGTLFSALICVIIYCLLPTGNL